MGISNKAVSRNSDNMFRDVSIEDLVDGKIITKDQAHEMFPHWTNGAGKCAGKVNGNGHKKKGINALLNSSSRLQALPYSNCKLLEFSPNGHKNSVRNRNVIALPYEHAKSYDKSLLDVSAKIQKYKPKVGGLWKLFDNTINGAQVAHELVSKNRKYVTAIAVGVVIGALSVYGLNLGRDIKRSEEMYKLQNLTISQRRVIREKGVKVKELESENEALAGFYKWVKPYSDLFVKEENNAKKLKKELKMGIYNKESQKGIKLEMAHSNNNADNAARQLARKVHQGTYYK